jgi:hypothetical protein
MYYFIVLCHYYVTIIAIICTIISYYFKVLPPYFQELVDAYSRPMHRAMTDKCPGAPAKLWGEQASSHYEAKPKYSAEKRLLYVLFLVLFLLFQLSVQDLAA